MVNAKNHPPGGQCGGEAHATERLSSNTDENIRNIYSLRATVGFGFGVHHISSTKKHQELHDKTVIAYFTNWAQLFFLFILGGYALLNTWSNLQNLQSLLCGIYKIDFQFEQAIGRVFNYTRMRKHMCIQVIVTFVVTASLSMVNCIIIYWDPEDLNFKSTCFWFVCFFPLLLLTFKELQFYNLMFILKSKFDVINEELAGCVGNSILGINFMPRNLCERIAKPQCTLETLKHLLQIYANLGDCVELLLRIFAWHLVLMTCASFGAITIEGYNLFAALVARTIQMGYYQVVVIICWCLVQIGVIGVNVSACCKTNNAMSLTGTLLHRIAADCVAVPELHSILQIFSLEVMQRKDCFTAAGFFNMDYKLITSIVAAVTTYLLIIIQFHTSLDKRFISNNV
ncbi:putative gustatory receptor 2a [Stomoxys calcitrans]|uniref:putative gustatory receptor 2a n=1 Tax=Stomoxys calcitrans TaxID=35570 RepID=UPI0027E32C76|nr:putative gustatory receptor 2a [Stomoxys calcitrans]